jgi:hypothetical protein
MQSKSCNTMGSMFILDGKMRKKNGKWKNGKVTKNGK